jgi:predicted N-acyltransferase
VPFTPVAGQRILVRNTPYRDQVFDALVKALKSLTTKVSYFKVYFSNFLEFQITVPNILQHACPAVYQFGLA